MVVENNPWLAAVLRKVPFAQLTPMPSPVVIRFATAADAEILAEHRVLMFRDAGKVLPQVESALRQTSMAYFATAIPSGEYVGWLAVPTQSDHPVAGAGVQLRSRLPGPTNTKDAVLLGQEGLLLNVYTDQAWRGRGIASALVEGVIDWAIVAGIVRLVLTAAPPVRSFYERLGFVGAREMAYVGTLARGGRWTGEEILGRTTAPSVQTTHKRARL